jgi:mycofactocin precursor
MLGNPPMFDVSSMAESTHNPWRTDMADPTVDRTDDIASVDPAVREDSGIEDVLVEEISIDGMCGVY